MPAAVAVPAIMGAVGATSSAIGAAKGSSQPMPQAVFPQMQQQYLQNIGGSTGLGQVSANTMKEMARTGMPTDVGPMFDALVASQKRQTDQGRSNILEQFGASGMRYSTPVMNSLVDYESQVNANYGSILSSYVFQAMEAARGRQMQASSAGLDAMATPALTLQGQPAKASPWSAFGTAVSGGAQMVGSLMNQKKP
jgi:hypothetical protein